MAPTDAQRACFEVGIKFGALYHQFAGTPVSPESAPSLERAIERSIANQPHCERVDVAIHADRLDTEHGYDELTGRHMEVEVRVDVEGTTAAASMSMHDGYPLMELDRVAPSGAGSEG